MKKSLFSQLSFRTQLALFFGVFSFLVLLAASLLWGSRSTKLLEASIQNELQARVHVASELIMTGLRDRSKEVVELARTPGLSQSNNGLGNLQSAMDNKRSNRSEYAWIGVSSPEGNIIAATDQMLLGKDVAQREWFKMGHSGLWMGDIHEAVLLNHLIPREKIDEPLRFIDIAAPIQDKNGQLLGVLGAHLHWSWITSLAEAVLPEDAESRQIQIFILNREGVTLYPFSETGKISFKQSNELKAQASELIWADNKNYVTAQIGLPQTPDQHLGWRIILRQPVDVAYGQLLQFVMQMVVLTLLIAMCAAWLTYWLASIINAPLTLLVQAVKRLGKDSDRFEAPQRLPQELRTLADAIQTAATNLTESRKELLEANELLEQRVLDRTMALGIANDALAMQAMTDGLTNIANRRAFDQKLTELHALSARTQQAYGLLIIDADHFKHVNDTYGHNVGDQVLAAIATQIASTIRSTDFVARYGGEEFVVLLYPLINPDELAGVAEKLRSRIEQYQFPSIGHITISLGGCVVQASSVEKEGALKCADSALYRSKANGRNRYTLE